MSVSLGHIHLPPDCLGDVLELFRRKSQRVVAGPSLSLSPQPSLPRKLRTHPRTRISWGLGGRVNLVMHMTSCCYSWGGRFDLFAPRRHPRPAAGTKHEGREENKNVDANDTCRALSTGARPRHARHRGDEWVRPQSKQVLVTRRAAASQYPVSISVCVLLYVPFFFVLSSSSPPFIRGHANTHVRSWA